ncbi:MAG: universal stress protein [Chitinivibrionales bacterium]|nr:universal stress protein [Chitinivibrionales bacterium]
MFKKILAAYDGSEGSKNALARAFTVAQEYTAPITMVWVRDTLPQFAATVGEVEDEKEAAEDYFNTLKNYTEQIASARNMTVDSACLKGHAAREIVQYAEKHGFDLIVIGQVGHSGFFGRMLGSTADRITETAHCDVLIVRRVDKK